MYMHPMSSRITTSDELIRLFRLNTDELFMVAHHYNTSMRVGM